jgi:uncharacterized RDD family membrane protein YckC
MTTEIEQIDWMHWIYRLIAYIIDSIIIAIPTYIVWFIITLAVSFSPLSFFAVYGIALVFPFIFGIIEVLYFAVLDVMWGATIGKRILGLQVQMVNGGKVPFGKAFIRNISKIYWIFLLLDWLIGIVSTGDKRQKFTDRFAGTNVIQVKQAFGSMSTPPPPPPPPPPS